MPNKGQKFRCTNRECNCEFEVVAVSEIDGQANPRCLCGSEMKKPYAKPTARSLEGEEAQRAKGFLLARKAASLGR